MIFFARYRAPIYLLAALPVSLVALLLVHQMPIAMPSSIDPLVPVLRSNYWLTIHVLTITLGYSAFLLALGIADVTLFHITSASGCGQGGADPRPRIVALNQLTYRLLCSLAWCCYRRAPSWAGSGRIIPGAGSGAGTPRRPGH